MKNPHSLLIIALASIFLLAGCELNNKTPPITPPDEIDPIDPGPPGGEPGDVFDVLELAWQIDIPQGNQRNIIPPMIHINENGVLFFSGPYFPGAGECAYDAPDCQHARTWTINPEGTIRGTYDVQIDGYSPGEIYVHSTLPAPGGDAFIVGNFGLFPTQGFMQRINENATPVGPITVIPVVSHLTANPERTMLFDVGRTHDHTFVRGTDVAPTVGTNMLKWHTRVTDNVIPRYMVYNNGEIHVLVSEQQLAPSVMPTEFIALDAETGQILHKTILPRSAPTDPGNAVEETPTSLAVNTAGQTLMYTYTSEVTPSGSTIFPNYITEIIYEPATRSFTHNKIEFMDPNMFSISSNMHPVAMPSGDILLSVRTRMGYALVATKNSEVQWIHDLHPGTGDPPNYEPMAITFHPTAGYYVLGSWREAGIPAREGFYHLMRFPGFKYPDALQ